MIITGMTEEQIRWGVDRIPNAAVVYINQLGQRGPRWRVKLTVESTQDGKRFYRTSARGNGRKVRALCWHGFREVMRQWFRACPDARIHTGMATYCGSDEFETFHGVTGNKNIGSQMQPMRARDACGC